MGIKELGEIGEHAENMPLFYSITKLEGACVGC
jgi:hypothetical protein